MFILKLPENKKSSVLGEVLEPNPIAAKQINHIATLTDFTSNVLKACAVANVAKFILYEDAKKKMRIFKRGAFSHLVWGDLKQREIVLNWKKEGNRLLKEGKEPKELKLDFKLLAESLASEGILDFDIITIPPPSFHEFEKDKGWYPAEIMAKKLCKQMGAKELQLLWPERYKDKKAKFMAANINKAYPPPAINVKGRFVFILDDIATTGLTLSAACKAVVEAGGYPFCMGFV